MKTPQQLQVEQRKQTVAQEFNCPPIPEDLLEWLEGTYYARPLHSSDQAHVDGHLKLAGQLNLIAHLRTIHEEQRLETDVDRQIGEGIRSPDVEVQL